MLSRAALALFVVLQIGCAHTAQLLARGDAELQSGHARAALVAFDAAAARSDASAAERARALSGAASACTAVGDRTGALSRLERAIEPEVSGEVEPALFALAELLRESDPARALNLYYRAAAGSQRYRAGAFPYQAAMNRILQLSMSR